MSGPNFPYPPGPTDIPEGMTGTSVSFARKQYLVFACLLAFHLYYLATAMLIAAAGIWCLLTVAEEPVLKTAGMVVSGTCFVFLLKGYFRRPAADGELRLEITRDEHPALFGFIRRLCGELGAPEPNRVYVAPDVNARVLSRMSLVHLFVEPPRDLVIGLGLVNCTNLSEFKAALAHELGHIMQLHRAARCARILDRMARDLVTGEDEWLDQWNRRFGLMSRRRGVRSAIGFIGTGVVQTMRALMVVVREPFWWVLQVITLRSQAVSREGELHADRVAARAAGSDAATHCLFRARFGMQCLAQATEGLALAIDQKLYSRDVYHHQARAADVVRRKQKNREAGRPSGDVPAGKMIRVFGADREAARLDGRLHPSLADREENIKRAFVDAPVDERSPWLLFSAVEELKERMTGRLYRAHFGVEGEIAFTDPVGVQEYLDRELAGPIDDPLYHGVYGDRMLDPGDLAALTASVRDTPWTVDQIAAMYAGILDGCREQAQAHAVHSQEVAAVNVQLTRRPSRKMRRIAERASARMSIHREWFQSFDRRVYLLHLQMAGQLDPVLVDELVERYRVHLLLQRYFQEARHNFDLANAYLATYRAGLRGEISLPGTFESEAVVVLRAAWRTLQSAIQEARQIHLPKLPNLQEHEPLSDIILKGELVPDPPLSELSEAWVHGLMGQLQGVRDRCRRLHHKSLGGLLALQEQIAAAWVAAHAADVSLSPMRPSAAAMIQGGLT